MSTGSTGPPTQTERCVEDGGASLLAIAGVTILLAAPIITTAYLAYRLRQQPAAATA